MLRRLGHDLDLNVVTASLAGLSQGRPPPEGTENTLVVPHYGDILSHIRNNDAWIGAFGYLFLEGCGGPLDTTRQTTSALFVKWVRILLYRRDSSWRKNRVFLFGAAAICFRHEALNPMCSSNYAGKYPLMGPKQ